MKLVVVAAAVMAIAAAFTTIPAAAQSKAPVYRYCLMNNSHPGEIGAVLCRYDTWQQCLASRHSFADTCYVNPQYVFRR